MYTTEITKKELREGRLFITVSFSNNEKTFEEAFTVSSVEALESIVKDRVQNLEKAETLFNEIELGVLTIKDEPVVISEEEKQEEENKRQIRYKLELALRDVELGILTKEDYEGLKTSLLEIPKEVSKQSGGDRL